MDFKTLFNILKNRISDGDDVPSFMRYIIAMITELSEADWNAPKDPTNKVKESTLRNYSKQGISQKLARSIVYRLDKDNFINEISEKPLDVRMLLADDIHPYDPSATADNVSVIITDILIDIIRTAAGLTSADKLNEQKQLQSSSDLKSKYGGYLLKECDNHCAMPGCGKLLYVSKDANVSNVYEITHIDKKKGTSVNNLIALCPMCFATYQLDNSAKTLRNLKATKKSLSIHMENMLELSTIELEKGLTEVIVRISNLKQKDFSDLSMNPKEINEKIDPDENFLLYNQVKTTVTTYFIKIKEIMESLDKGKIIDYEELQHQMKSAYKKIKSGNKSKSEVFYSLSEKLHKVTLQEIIFCQVIVCYFIQSCEVFDATT